MARLKNRLPVLRIHRTECAKGCILDRCVLFCRGRCLAVVEGEMPLTARALFGRIDDMVVFQSVESRRGAVAERR